MSLKGPCIIAWFWVEFPKHLSQYYTASWSRCAHLAMCTYMIIIYVICHSYRYTCAHDIIYTIPMLYNDALLSLWLWYVIIIGTIHGYGYYHYMYNTWLCILIL